MVPPVAPLLGAASSVTDLVGTVPKRIYHGTAPQNTLRPYVTWSIVIGMPTNYLAQRPGMDNYRVQIDCWADDATQAQGLARAVRDTLETQATQISTNMDERDAETGLWRYSFDWSFWTRRV